MPSELAQIAAPLTTLQAGAIYVRWATRPDHARLAEIERLIFPDNHWQARDFAAALRQRHCIGNVAVLGNAPTAPILGYMCYELHADRFKIVNLGVHPDWQRCGIGRGLVERLVAKLHRQRRRSVELLVRERNLPAQLFFKALHFQATDVLRDYYEVNNEAAYQFERRLLARRVGCGYTAC